MLDLFHAQIEPKRFRQLFTYPTSVNGPERVKKGPPRFVTGAAGAQHLGLLPQLGLGSRLAARSRFRLFLFEAFEAGDVPSRSSIGTEHPIPEKMDHREIAVRVPVMNEVQLLFPSEPRKPLKSRSLYVVFPVEKDVRVERRCASNYLNHEEIKWQ